MITRILLLSLYGAFIAGCASSNARKESPFRSRTEFSKNMSTIHEGMAEAQVRSILGEPDDTNAYVTGKAFIPFYFGSDTHRTDWMYKGKGRVAFSRNRWSGGLKVVRVLYNPSELE